MTQRYLEISFHKGRPLMAYLHLSGATGLRSARTIDAGQGISVDFDDQGRPIGVEITAPTSISADDLNAILVQHGIGALENREFARFAA